MMFMRSFVFFLAVLATLFLGWAGIVGLPDMQISLLETPTALQRYTFQQAYGRAIYIREGCVYCHSQQTRPTGFGGDQGRRWGRASVPSDYMFDQPHLLGTMRTGPDLLNIAVRQPSEEWHLVHLYQPRAVAPGSLMPPFPWLFRVQDTAGPAERVVGVPVSYAPRGKVVVATQEALDLVAYLLSLNRTYPVEMKRVANGGAKTSR